MSFPSVPPEVKGIAHYLKVAEEHEGRNVVISYWSRMYACQTAMKIVPGKKSPEVSKLLIAIMDWLEQTKNENRDVDGITDEIAAQAIIEEYVVQLFTYADAQDRAEIFNKNTIKAFYTAGILADVLQQFGPLSEDLHSKRKYAKWKAAYIHNCLKIGDVPLPGPPSDNQDDKIIHKSEIEGFREEDEESVVSNEPSLPSVNIQPIPPPPANWPGFPEIGEPTVPTVSPVAPEPLIPQPVPRPVIPPAPSSMGGSGSSVNLTPDQMEKAQKYCKWAASALNYDDVKTAVDNLQKALHLLQVGEEK